MPRAARIAPGGYAYHVLNRGVGRMTLFDDDDDYAAFVKVLVQALDREPGVELFAFCLMPNHWHMVLRPAGDGELARFMQWLTLTHTRRWQEHRHCHGSGHVYQGRFKSFPIETDRHFLTVCRYVERNALRAGLVERAEDWPWGSLSVRRSDDVALQELLSDWPVSAGKAGGRSGGGSGGVPRQWLRTVNAAMKARELEAVRRCVDRGRPFGGEAWVKKTSARLGLEHTFRSRGRPRKEAIA